MTPKAVETANPLIHQRKRLLSMRWNVISHQEGGGWISDHSNSYPFDEELAQAVEKFRERRIAEIDDKLRELGIETT